MRKKKLEEQNKALAKANAYMTKLYLELEEAKGLIDQKELELKDRNKSTAKFNAAMLNLNATLEKQNIALSKANANISNLYIELENYKLELEKQNKSLSKANANISNLYVELENYEKQLELKNSDLSDANKEILHINNITRIANSTLDVDAIMNTAIQAINAVCKTDGIVIQLLDKDKKHLSTYKVYNLTMKKQLKTWKLDIEKEKSFLIHVMNEKKYLFIPDIHEKKNISLRDEELKNILNFTSIAIFPLEVQENSIGCIFFFCKKAISGLDEKKLAYLQNIILNVATAIHNAVIYNDLKRTKIELYESRKIITLNKVFEKFVPKQFLQRVAQEGIDKIQLGYAKKENLTILFSDIRSFTSLSELIEAHILLEFMNDYFQQMNDIIYKNNGFIDKFIGDAIMALFEQDPNEALSDATRAVNAAVCMQVALKKFNETNSIAKKYPVSIGVGIHSGDVIMGAVGSAQRTDTTVLGDNVNLAARLEKATKLYGVKILISQDTFNKLENKENYFYRPLGLTEIIGRKSAVDIFEIFNSDQNELIQLKMQTKPHLEKGLAFLKVEAWHEAAICFEKALNLYPEDKATQLLFDLATPLHREITHPVSK